MSRVDIIHIGDLHLGPGPGNADRRDALDQVIRYGVLHSDTLGAWVWPGDLNHRRMTIDDENWLAGRLHSMAELAPVVICTGNHDVPGDLDIFKQLRTKHSVSVVTSPQVLTVCTAGSNVMASIFVLPYPTKGGLVQMGADNRDADGMLDAIISNGAIELEQQEGHIQFAIGHVNVRGSVASTGQPQIGKEIELTAGHLGHLRGPVLLNHIHKAQLVHHASYAGSLCRLDWGEVEPKSFTVVRFTQNDTATGWRFDSHREPIDVPPMYHVEGDVNLALKLAWPVSGYFTWNIKAGPEGEHLEAPTCANGPPFTGCDVRVRYRFPASQRDTVDVAAIRAPFEGARRLVLEPIAVPDTGLRSPEVANAVGLRDKVNAWAHEFYRHPGEDHGRSITDAVEEKLRILEGTDPDFVLGEVSAWLQRQANEDGQAPAVETPREEQGAASNSAGALPITVVVRKETL